MDKVIKDEVVLENERRRDLKLIASRTDTFNRIKPEDTIKNRDGRTRALANILGMSTLKGIVIPGFSHCKPSRSFQEESDPNCFYARIAVNSKDKNRSYLAIEKRKGEDDPASRTLEKLIPLEVVGFARAEAVTKNEAPFNLILNVSDLYSIVTPNSITF